MLNFCLTPVKLHRSCAPAPAEAFDEASELRNLVWTLFLWLYETTVLQALT